jgi:hypothetical protein
MKSLTFAVCSLVLLLGTLGAGWMQRNMSHTWGNPRDRERAGDRLLTTLPAQLGDWRFHKDAPFTPAVLAMLQEPVHISKVYENMRTGDIVTVAVIVGHPGPVAVHTPEVCYSSRDYQVPSSRKSTEIKTPGGRAHSLWTLRLAPKEPDDLPLTVMYGWSTGTTWEAAEHPRYSYGGLSHLYKLQLAVTSHEQSSEDGYDPARDFAQAFVAQLEPLLVESDHRQAAGDIQQFIQDLIP